MTLHELSISQQLDLAMSHRDPIQQLKETKRMHLRTKEANTSDKTCANSGKVGSFRCK